MSWLKRFSRAEWTVLTTLMVVVFIFVWLLLKLLALYMNHSGTVASIEPRLARLYGLIQHEQQLRSAYEQSAAVMDKLVYTSGEDANALAAGLQQRIRGYLTQAGMDVSGSQVRVNNKAEKGFVTVSVNLTAQGSLTAIQEALLDIDQARPLLLVDSIDVRPVRQRRGSTDQLVTVRIDLTGLQKVQP